MVIVVRLQNGAAFGGVYRNQYANPSATDIQTYRVDDSAFLFALQNPNNKPDGSV